MTEKFVYLHTRLGVSGNTVLEIEEDKSICHDGSKCWNGRV